MHGYDFQFFSLPDVQDNWLDTRSKQSKACDAIVHITECQKSVGFVVHTNKC